MLIHPGTDDLPFWIALFFPHAGDPRSEQISGFRAYSLGLNVRGRSALQHWPGLWERVATKVGWMVIYPSHPIPSYPIHPSIYLSMQST